VSYLIIILTKERSVLILARSGQIIKWILEIGVASATELICDVGYVLHIFIVKDRNYVMSRKSIAPEKLERHFAQVVEVIQH